MAITNADRRLAGTMIAERVPRAKEFWEDHYYRRLRDFDDYYHVRLPKILEQQLADDDRSSLVPPDIHILTNDFRAHIVRPFYRARKIARLLGRGPNDVRNEPFAQKLFDWNLDTTDRWQELDKDAHSIATKGFAVNMTELRPMSHTEVDAKGHIREVLLFGGAPLPRSVHLEALRFFPDPMAKILTWPECRYVIYQASVTKEGLYHERAKDKQRWIFTDDDMKQLWRGVEGREKVPDSVQRMRVDAYYETQPSPNDALTLDWYIGDFTSPDRPTDFRQAIVGAINEVLVYFSMDKADAPLVEMFHVMGINTEDDRLISMGKIEAIEDSFLELYTKRNQSVELANLGGYGTHFIQRGHGIPESHRVGPYTYIEVDNPLDLKTMNPVPNTVLAIEATNSRNELRDAYGSNYSLGLNPDERESATGANILVESQSVLNHSVALQIWNSGLRRECQLRNTFLQLYAPDEIWVRVSEDRLRPMQRLSREQILGNFDYELAVGLDDFMPEAVRQGRVERLVAMYRGDPDIDQLELKRRHLNVMGLNDTELLIVSTDEKVGWARAENAIIMQHGIRMPLWGGEDHMIHAQTHLQAILSGIDLARQNLVRAENLNPLMEHYQLHLVELQATLGIQTDNSQVLPSGTSGSSAVGQPRAQLGSNGGGPMNRIEATRSAAQTVANARAGPFQ